MSSDAAMTLPSPARTKAVGAILDSKSGFVSSELAAKMR